MEDQEKGPKYTYEDLKEKYIDKKIINTKNKSKEVANDYNMFISFVVNLILLVFLGIFVGNFIDNKINTKPLFILLLTLLGIGAAFRNLIKSIIKHDKGSSKNGKPNK